jgi:hypothetical protein
MFLINIIFVANDKIISQALINSQGLSLVYAVNGIVWIIIWSVSKTIGDMKYLSSKIGGTILLSLKSSTFSNSIQEIM